jgi:small subunit ribosomal protein S16
MLMIRFQRIGRKNDASFRMAVLEKTAGPKAGKYVDLVGTYNPKTKQITYKADRIKDWITKGAQVSPSLKNLLIKNGVLEGSKSAVISKKNLEKNIAKKAAEDAAAAAKAADEKAKADAAAAKAAEEAAAAETEAAAAPEPEAPAAVEEAPVEAAPSEEAAPEEAKEEEPAA